MKNITMLKKINFILNKDNQTIKEKLLQFKQELEFEIMQENNFDKNMSLKTVAKSCLEILKVQKARPILQKAVIRNNQLELTDSYRMIVFKDKNYIEIPTHDAETTTKYPSFDIIINNARLNDLEITLNIEDIRKKYKIYKTLRKDEQLKPENIGYIVYYDELTNFKVNVGIDFLNSMLDIFSCEKNFKVKINSRYNYKPITFESDNILALLLPVRI